MAPSNDEALARFLGIVGEIQATLDGIQEAVDDHFDLQPDEVTWTSVGDVTRTMDDLKQVLAVIRGENR